MSEETTGVETQADATATETAPTQETSTDETLREESKTPKSAEESEYQAELQRLQSQLTKAEKALVKNKTEKKKPSIDEDALVEKLLSKMQEQQGSFMQQEREEYIDTQIDVLASSSDEAKLIKFHLENTLNVDKRSKRSVDEAVEMAKLLANRNKLSQQNEELSAALAARQTTRTSVAAASQRGARSRTPHISSEEKEFLQAMGVKDFSKLKTKR